MLSANERPIVPLEKKKRKKLPIEKFRAVKQGQVQCTRARGKKPRPGIGPRKYRYSIHHERGGNLPIAMGASVLYMAS